MNNVVNGYIEKSYAIIPIGEKNDIRVLTSECEQTGSMLIDIRKFSLYGNSFDNIKRPTKKGIKFKLHNVMDVIKALVQILVDHKALDEDVGQNIIVYLDSNYKG